MKLKILAVFLPLNIIAQSSPIDKKTFQRVLSIAESVFQPLARNFGETLIIDGDYEDPWINANGTRDRQDKNYIVYLYGGIARQPESTLGSLSLAICHELGHGYGGEPLADTYNFKSVEGQADYWASGTCLTQLLTALNISYANSNPYVHQICFQKFGSDPNYFSLCLTKLVSAQNLSNLLARVRKEKLPNFQTPDSTIVSKTLDSHPEKVQCRLDTFFAGAFEAPKPLCWHRPL